MTSYKNREGVTVEVDTEHLSNSLRVYDELSKLSPSGRVSWARHKRMMEEDGFDDSDSSENYRQMIKAERKRQGVLPSREEIISLETSNKLDSVKP